MKTCLSHLPFAIDRAAVAAIYSESLFIVGLGEESDEIWQFGGQYSVWRKCASPKKDRLFHSIVFIRQILFVCGGSEVNYHYEITDYIEAYDSINEDMSIVWGWGH